MRQINDNFSILYLGTAAVIYFRPEYAILNSRVVTIAILFTILTVSRIIYALVLYPEYFTPLKHIQTPLVSQPLLSVGTVEHNSRFLGTKMAYWQFGINVS